MGLLQNIRSWVVQWLAFDELLDRERTERLTRQELLSRYYQGEQKRQMKVKPGQADDNITLNYSGLVIDRAISMLVGGGIEFDLPGDGEPPEQVYIDSTWDANRRNILIHNAVQYAAVFGTGYLKILPNAIAKDEAVYHRLVAVDPRWMTVHTMPEDVEMVQSYETRFNIVRGDRTIGRKELISRQLNEVDGLPLTDSWIVENYESSQGGKWELIDSVVWDYDFPPIIHWQNLPIAGSQYGESDISDTVELQDRINFVASNISKIIRYHAHPKMWGRGMTTPSYVDFGADKLMSFTGENAMLANLEMQSDLTSSAAYLMNLRQSLFDISRTVDITSLSDKLGALTNFGLHVLFTDALAKIQTKQQLFGDALLEINRRLLVLGNMQATDPGGVVWPDNIPTNRLEELQAEQIALGLGIVSKQTAAEGLGYDWEDETERLEGEQAAGGNIGAELLRAFNVGQ